MRVTIKAINDELAKRSHDAQLEKGDGYFYFSGKEAADWLDRTVSAKSLSSLTLDQWVDEFERLKKLNKDILRKAVQQESSKARPVPAKKRQRKSR